jgi:hypothetical protein
MKAHAPVRILFNRLLLSAATVSISGSVYAASIGVQFGGAGSSLMNIYLSPAETAGVVGQANWNVVRDVGGEQDFNIVNDVTGQLRDAAGALTAVQL